MSVKVSSLCWFIFGLSVAIAIFLAFGISSFAFDGKTLFAVAISIFAIAIIVMLLAAFVIGLAFVISKIAPFGIAFAGLAVIAFFGIFLPWIFVELLGTGAIFDLGGFIAGLLGA